MNFITPSLCIDVLLLVVLIIFMVMYIKKGFIAGLVEFLGTLISVGAAVLVANKFSPKVFESFFEQNLIEKMTTTISTNQGVLTLEEIINKVRGILPANIAQAFLGDVDPGNLFDTAAPDIAQQVVEQVIRPLIVPIISVLLFFAVFALAKVLLTFIAAALTNVNKIPLVGGVNRLLGVVMGLLVGIINVFLLVCILWAVVIVTGNDIPVLNQAVLNQSYFYKIFSGFIPFL